MIMRNQVFICVVALGLACPTGAQPSAFYQRYEAGRAQLDQGQFEVAVATFQSALAAAGGEAPDPNIYVALGYAQMRSGRIDDAVRSFNSARNEIGKLTPNSRLQLDANSKALDQLRQH
jgi:Flp pilus assembly protein TadD